MISATPSTSTAREPSTPKEQLDQEVEEVPTPHVAVPTARRATTIQTRSTMTVLANTAWMAVPIARLATTQQAQQTTMARAFMPMATVRFVTGMAGPPSKMRMGTASVTAMKSPDVKTALPATTSQPQLTPVHASMPMATVKFAMGTAVQPFRTQTETGCVMATKWPVVRTARPATSARSPTPTTPNASTLTETAKPAMATAV